MQPEQWAARFARVGSAEHNLGRRWVQDLEIYIRDLEPGQLSHWLQAHLDELELDDASLDRPMLKGQGKASAQPVSISLYPGAMGRRYACLVLEGSELPWASDLACARSAWEALQVEVRCSPGGWQEGDPVADEKWWRLDQRGEQLVAWN